MEAFKVFKFMVKSPQTDGKADNQDGYIDSIVGRWRETANQY
jgi:hypothetical protein